MPRELSYPARLDEEPDGGFIATFPDLPEVITQGDDIAEVLSAAADALAEAMAGRVRRSEPIPDATSDIGGHVVVPVPALIAAKVALYLALEDSGLSKSELARRVGCDEKEVRRLLDPRYASKITRIQKALVALGRNLAVTLVDTAA